MEQAAQTSSKTDQSASADSHLHHTELRSCRCSFWWHQLEVFFFFSPSRQNSDVRAQWSASLQSLVESSDQLLIARLWNDKKSVKTSTDGDADCGGEHLTPPHLCLAPGRNVWSGSPAPPLPSWAWSHPRQSAPWPEIKRGCQSETH